MQEEQYAGNVKNVPIQQGGEMVIVSKWRIELAKRSFMFNVDITANHSSSSCTSKSDRYNYKEEYKMKANWK